MTAREGAPQDSWPLAHRTATFWNVHVIRNLSGVAGLCAQAAPLHGAGRVGLTCRTRVATGPAATFRGYSCSNKAPWTRRRPHHFVRTVLNYSRREEQEQVALPCVTTNSGRTVPDPISICAPDSSC
eukprot:scaffold870_cov393-Prasinococcus_capsulatus_cf.AAC.30